MQSYTIIFVICHQGGSRNEGHYIAAMSVPGELCDARVQWKWRMTDDKQLEAASARMWNMIYIKNCCIIGLARMLNGFLSMLVPPRIIAKGLPALCYGMGQILLASRRGCSGADPQVVALKLHVIHFGPGAAPYGRRVCIHA